MSAGLGRDSRQPLAHLPAQALVEQEVLRRVPAHGELGEHDEVGGPGAPHLAQQLRNPGGVPGHVAHQEVLLGERDAEGVGQRSSSCMALPSSAGERTVRTPAFSSAANLAAAVPSPPEMIAPAWPMRLPGGAVTPAM